MCWVKDHLTAQTVGRVEMPSHFFTLWRHQMEGQQYLVTRMQVG